MDVKAIIPTEKFTQPQLDLLKMFSRELPDEDWIAIRNMAKQYFADKLTAEMDRLFEENGWGKEKMEEWSKEHMRTPFKN